jgi:osmotically-inducible protein OsmY
MNRYAVSLTLCLLLAQLSACTAYQAYRKCGFSGCPGDKEIAAQIETALRATPGISYWDIQVQSLDHVVYLYGLVDTNPERARVEEVASSVSGGLKIVNSISIRANIGR